MNQVPVSLTAETTAQIQELASGIVDMPFVATMLDGFTPEERLAALTRLCVERGLVFMQAEIRLRRALKPAIRVLHPDAGEAEVVEMEGETAESFILGLPAVMNMLVDSILIGFRGDEEDDDVLKARQQAVVDYINRVRAGDIEVPS